MPRSNVVPFKQLDDVPIPPPMRFTYGLDKLKVGQSKLFTNYNRADAVYKLAQQNAKRTGNTYVCRTMDGGGIRIWRTK